MSRAVQAPSGAAVTQPHPQGSSEETRLLLSSPGGQSWWPEPETGPRAGMHLPEGPGKAAPGLPRLLGDPRLVAELQPSHSTPLRMGLHPNFPFS